MISFCLLTKYLKKNLKNSIIIKKIFFRKTFFLVTNTPFMDKEELNHSTTPHFFMVKVRVEKEYDAYENET